MSNKEPVRAALLKQEIERMRDKLNYHQGRMLRGTADAEDTVAWNLYDDILRALERMV